MRGFTLVETLVALGIISVGFISVLGLLSSTQASFVRIRDNVVAAMLAQEGVELVHNVRDTNWLERDPDGWYDLGSGSCLDFDGVNNPGGLFPCSGVLYFDEARGIYTHAVVTSTPSVFSRSITVIPIVVSTSTPELRIAVTISWQRRGVARSLSVEEHLFDWK